MEAIWELRMVAARARAAFRDAEDDPSSYVARDIRLLKAAVHIEDRRQLTREVAAEVEKKMEQAIGNLRMSGYIVDGV